MYHTLLKLFKNRSVFHLAFLIIRKNERNIVFIVPFFQKEYNENIYGFQ